MLALLIGCSFFALSASPAQAATISVPADQPTIQAAIDAASPGDTINVGAGTYPEQLIINKSVNLVGAGIGSSIIQAPATLPASGAGSDSSIVRVIGAGVSAEITGFTVAGPGPSGCGSIVAAIFVRDGAAANIHDNRIQDASDNPLSGCQNGVGIFVGRNSYATTGAATITNNQIVSYQKGGIVVDNTGSDAVITGNTVTGIGTTAAIAQNGIQISRGATATLSGNTITGNSFHLEGNPWDWGSAGVLLYQSGAVTLTGGNTMSGNDTNLYIQATTGPVTLGAEDFGPSTAPLDIGYHVVNYNSTGLDLTGCTFEGVAAASGTAAQLLGIKARVWDGIDEAGLGVAALKAGNQYVSASGSIQRAIDAASAGDTVNIAAGTYTENVRVNKSVTLAGSGAAATIVRPAVSLPNPCAGSSLCGGPTASSNVMVVEANDVTIHDLAIEGDNTDLATGIDRGGANVDARNGIIKNTDATYNNLEVYNTTVRNIYLRGIYSTGGSFNFHDNTVTNVQGDSGSIAMFAWYGPGIMADNTVSYANDAIAANHSSGIQFTGNTVTHSASGVHTDNSGDGGLGPDLIQNNSVDCTGTPGAYGVWVFVPYIAPTVNHNTVTNCSVGLSAWAGAFGTTVTAAFTNNTVNGPAFEAGSVGAYITTDSIGWGYTDVAVDFTGNIITGNETGVYLTADAQSWNPSYTAQTITANFSNNEINGNTAGMDKGTGGTINADARNNWWGDASGPYNAGSNSGGTGNSVADGILYNPWLGMAPITPTVTYVGPTGEVNVGNPEVTATATPGTSTLSAELSLARVDVADPWTYQMYVFPCSVSGGNVSCSTSGLPEGDYTATVTVWDTEGRIGTGTGAFNIVDNAPPVTTDNAPSGWQTADVTVTLSCTDAVSGCASTSYSVDGAPAQTGNTVLINTDGIHTITYHSVDNLGQVEADKTATVQLDKTAPLTTSNADSNWHNSDVTVTLSCADATSGCASTSWSADNGGGSGSGGSVVISNEGATTITYHSVDVAGNVEVDRTATVMLDKTAPAVSDDAPIGWHNHDVTVTLGCTDAVSGCASTSWSGDNGLGSGSGGSVPVSNDGVTTISYTSVDNAGNSSSSTATVSIDKVSPAVTYGAPSGTVYTLTDAITGTVADASPSSGSLTASLSLSFNGGPADTTACTITGGDIDCPVSGLLNGGYAATITVTDQAGNSGTASGSFTYAAHGKPDLGLSVTRTYWASYADYLMRSLSVDYKLTNRSTGITAEGVQIVGALNTDGVNLLTITPVAVGDIAAGANAGVTLKYLLPGGVTSFRTTIYAQSADPCGSIYDYPGAYPGP